MPSFDTGSAECFVFTFKDGVLSKMAHDLKIGVRRFAIDVPDDRSNVSAEFDLTSFEVICAMDRGREDFTALSASDRRKIEATITGDVLAKGGGVARFESRTITESGDRRHLVGDLTLAGVMRSVAFDSFADGRGRVAEVRLHQPDFGIRPYSAMLGALKLKPDVLVRVRIPIP